MADIAGTSSTPSKNDKPVIVRVKRKAFQSPLDAFWLEINERPVKRPLLDFGKLSLSDSSSAKTEGLKTKKVFVQHVETLNHSEVNIDVLQSLVPDTVNAAVSIPKSEDRRRTFKSKSKQDQLLAKAKKEQEILSKSARFEQVWRRRKGTTEANNDEVHEMCHLYDVVRIDVAEKTSEVKEQENTELEDHRIMSSFLPLLREFIPSAASEIESEFDDYMSKETSKDDYVYDLYAVKDDTMIAEDDSNPFPLIRVDDGDDFYDGPDESENESYDSNAEDNPMNEYPDEETSNGEEESESKTSGDKSEEYEDSVSSDEYFGHEGFRHNRISEDGVYGVDEVEDYDYFSEDKVYDDD